MNRRTRSPIRILSVLAAALVSTACLLTLSSDPTTTPEAALPPDTGPAPAAGTEAPPPPAELPVEPTLTLTPTLTATATETPLTMTAGQKLSCVKGPHWVLYDWVTSIEDGETVTLLARGMTEEEYYYIRKSDVKECWAFGGSSSTSGPTSGLPEREAPPLPQITLTIQNKTYLRITNLRMRPKDETIWGTNLLASHEVMGQETYRLTLTAGFYDIRLQDYHSGVVYEAHDVPIGADPGSSTIVLDGRYPVNIHSDTTSAMCRVAIESIDGTYHAELTIPGDGRIIPGETVTLEGLGGAYSIQFYRCGDDANWYGTGAYIGPVTATVTIL